MVPADDEDSPRLNFESSKESLYLLYEKYLSYSFDARTGSKNIRVFRKLSETAGQKNSAAKLSFHQAKRLYVSESNRRRPGSAALSCEIRIKSEVSISENSTPSKFF